MIKDYSWKYRTTEKDLIPQTAKKGLGFNNIFNRVEYYHGSIQLNSASGKGCTLQVEMPA